MLEKKTDSFARLEEVSNYIKNLTKKVKRCRKEYVDVDGHVYGTGDCLWIGEDWEMREGTFKKNAHFGSHGHKGASMYAHVLSGWVHVFIRNEGSEDVVCERIVGPGDSFYVKSSQLLEVFGVEDGVCRFWLYPRPLTGD